MNTAQQRAWNQLQSLYRVYCLNSISGSSKASTATLNALEKVMDDASCYLPYEYTEIKDSRGFIL